MTDETLNNFIRMEFTHWLISMMEEHLDFEDIRPNARLEVKVSKSKTASKITIFADMLFSYQGKISLATINGRAPLTIERVEAMIKRIKLYHSAAQDVKQLIYIVPDAVQDKYIQLFAGENIIVWDSSALAQIFGNQLEIIKDTPLYQILIDAAPKSMHVPSLEEQLIQRLISIPPGKTPKGQNITYWSQYQQLCAEILTHLFVPPLSRPRIEHFDNTKTNRRDIIFPNYAEDKFWLFMRQGYSAHYIVVDAKNSSLKIDKNGILQMSNYLRDFGSGLFGIICCRTKFNDGAVTTCRELWVAYKKLIISLNDSDITQMLTLKQNKQEPEEVIKQKIEDFRLGM